MRTARLGILGIGVVTLIACAPPAPEDVPTPAKPAEQPATTTEPASPVPSVSPRERDRRGDERLFAGDFDGAVADFDAYVAAEPEVDPYHWRRGIAYYYAGRFADGAAQFERHRVVNSADVENAAWHFLCVAKKDGLEAAREQLLPVGPDQRDPMETVYALYAGRATPQDVLDDAAQSRQRDAMFFAHLYLALYYDVAGDLDKARESILLATTRYGRDHYMGRIAQVHATLLGD